MFEDLFIDPRTIARYRSTPLLAERLSYLEHCAREGARHRTLREVAAHQTRLVHLLDLREAARVSMRRIEAVAMHRSRPDGRRSHRAARPGARQRFVGHALRWLRFAGLLEEPCETRHAHAGEVEGFAAWMRKERGWSSETIRCCLEVVERFFDGLDERSVSLASVRMCRHRPGSHSAGRPIGDAGRPGDAAGPPSTVMRNVFAPFSGSPNAKGGACRGWPTGSCRCGSIPARRSHRG